MQITFLGTGAAEGIPSPFCNCDTCEHARKHGGRNIRKRQSVLIDNKLLIDLGPDIFASCAEQGLSLCDVETMLITHSHSDHFDPENLVLREKAYRLATDLPDVTMIAGPSVWMRWDEEGMKDQRSQIKRTPILPGRTIQASGYTVTAIEANHHGTVGDAMNYMIDDGSCVLLFASDSGVYSEAVWHELSAHRFDAVILEGTVWGRPSVKEHLNETDFKLMMERMKDIGAATDKTTFIATHFSHQGWAGPHEEIEAKAARLGALCAYDGMSFQVRSQ
ncbi:adenosylcobinamide kinase [Bacillaceae bacterium SIJ1]|uniref:MBL fold metallo-hydrolase n=1 Tax=Litoribacterium kuwaitense TaxID=1398745 RepID=UPI0013EAAF1D|nr:MBL fold metallo-hydrolase [Litoribacterium kuwaitense]NGP44907.1 adenosylcobinamide kinase [Litoribacterium kuwaitense]